MSLQPRLAVLAVLAAGGAAFGGYYLWPSGRHVASCAPTHAPVPAAAQKALAAYAGRIRHDVQRPDPATREESWSDPLTGRTRYAVYERGRLMFAFGTVPTGGVPREVWVDYGGRSWRSEPLKFRGTITTSSLTRETNAAAAGAQANRDKVARGTAVIVGKELVGGRETLRLRETVHPPKPSFHAIGGLTQRVHIPPPPAIHLDTWVDPLTYVTRRTRTTVRGHSSVSDETWLPRTPTNIAATHIVIPDGFKHEFERSNVLTSFGVASVRCTQS
jgi:hypothetical protein